MQVTKKWIVLPATLALSVSGLAMAQQNRDNNANRDNETARERREREEREAKQDRRADAQSGVPNRVQQAVQQRYPKAKVSQIGTAQQNGVQTYLLRINADDGETSARATERGDFLYLGYPGVSYDRL